MENPDALSLPARLPRILIVDESRIARALLVKQLRERFDCREEADGEAAWQVLVLDHSLQLVICSLSLPVLDGNGLLARVRSSRLQRLRDMPMLMRYGDDEASLAQAKALGASDWLSRHADAAELIARVAALVPRKPLRAAADDAGEEFDGGAQFSQATRARLSTRADVEAAATRAVRNGGEVCVLAVGFDDVERLRAEQGGDIVRQLYLRFAAMIAGKIRPEDCLGRYSDDVFIVVTPGTPSAVCELFADRLRESIHLASIVVHGQRLNLSVSAGVSVIPADQASAGEALVRLALARLQAAQQAGGNRVVSCHAVLAPESSVPRVEHALALIKAGYAHEVVPHLAYYGRQVLPLMRLLEQHLKLGLPLAQIEKRLLDPAQESNDAGRDSSSAG